MPTPEHAGRRGARAWSGLAVYVAGWLLAGSLVAASVVVVKGGDAPPGRAATVPPVREFMLGAAVARAGCRITAREHGATGSAAPPAAGIYRRPISDAARDRGSLRGIVTIEYRKDTPRLLVGRLAALQRSVPRGTLLAPGAALRSDQLAVTTYGRQLRCRHITDSSLDALQLFRGRYLGSGRRR